MTKTSRHKNLNKSHPDQKDKTPEIVSRRQNLNQPGITEEYNIVGDNKLDSVTNEPEGFGRGWFGTQDVDGKKKDNRSKVKKLH